jgi:hypothetical protein
MIHPPWLLNASDYNTKIIFFDHFKTPAHKKNENMISVRPITDAARSRAGKASPLPHGEDQRLVLRPVEDPAVVQGAGALHRHPPPR